MKWLISVTGYGAFLFHGTEEEAEEMRAHKADWEGGVGKKRKASAADIKKHGPSVVLGDSQADGGGQHG